MNKIHWGMLLLLFGVCGCSKQENNVNLIQPIQCIKEQSQCQFNTQFGDINIAFNRQYLVAEQPFELHVNTEKTNAIKLTGYMEGVDMYMGKIPLFFSQSSDEHNEQTYVAKAMFGSCSNKKMQWRVWLEITDKKGAGAKQLISFTVMSYQSVKVIPAITSSILSTPIHHRETKKLAVR